MDESLRYVENRREPLKTQKKSPTLADYPENQYLCAIIKKIMKIFKRHRDYGFWDQDVRLSKLSQLGDPLERLNTCTMYEVRSKGVDFEMFRELFESRLTKEPQGKGGRPPYDCDDVQDYDPSTLLQSIGRSG